MGADTFMDLTDWKWKRSKDLVRLLQGRIVVFVRPIGGDGVAMDDVGNNLEKRVSTMNNGAGEAAGNVRIVRLDTRGATAIGNVSSTQIRSIRSREELKGLVTPQIEDFIVTNKLYGFSSGDN